MAAYKKIPYGISNFHDLIAQHYYYVDKTKYIEVLENFNEKYICFFRPRRFGKSLFVSLLCNYYEKAKAKEFDNKLSIVHCFTTFSIPTASPILTRTK